MKLKIELELNQWNTVLTHLGRGAYVEVVQLIENMAKQLSEQTRPRGAEEKPDLKVVETDK